MGQPLKFVDYFRHTIAPSAIEMGTSSVPLASATNEQEWLGCYFESSGQTSYGMRIQIEKTSATAGAPRAVTLRTILGHSSGFAPQGANSVDARVTLEAGNTGISGEMHAMESQCRVDTDSRSVNGTYAAHKFTNNFGADNTMPVDTFFLRFYDAGTVKTPRLFGFTGLTAGTGNLYYNETLKIKVNTNDRWIPLSTAQGTYTSAYPITLTNTLTIGVDATGHDVIFYGDRTGSDFWWDEDGQSNGSLNLGTTTVSEGVDLFVHGDTSANYLQWDCSADDLLLKGTATQLAVEGTAASTTTGTGSLRTAGGLGVAGRGNFGGIVIVTSTDATTAGVNAIYGYNDAGAVWTSGNQVGVRGKVAVSGSNNFVSATGVWAGLDFATATGSGSGLTCALNAEVSSNNSTVPNAVVYIQSLPGASGNFSDVPYLVFSETRGGGTATGSRYLFEVGHAAAATVPTIGTGELFYGNTLQIAVNETAGNRTNFFIPLSTVERTFTTAYPITSTSDTGYATTATFVPDTNYTDYALAIGWKGDANEIEVSFATDTGQNLNLIQMNVNAVATVTDEGPSASSQMNLRHSLITHNTDDMDNLRLKCTDYNVVVSKDLKDAYAYQGQIDVTDSAVGGEAAVAGLVMYCPSGTVTGHMRGLIVAMQGASMPSTSKGILVSTNVSATLDEGLCIESQNGTTITKGISFKADATGNITAAIDCRGDGMANILNFINAPSLSGCFDTTNSIGTQIGRILVNWGGTQRAIPVYALS